MHKEFDKMLEKILANIGHDQSAKSDWYPFNLAETRWFRSKDFGFIPEFNKKTGNSIMFLQERTLRMTDFVFAYKNGKRTKYQNRGIKPLVVKTRKAELELAGLGTFHPVILAWRLGWDFSDWAGLPLEEIIDRRMRHEREESCLVVGPLLLPVLEEGENVNPACPSTSGTTYSDVVIRGTKMRICRRETYFAQEKHAAVIKMILGYVTM
ncbi:hypothetical protein Aduo_018911 [Ancylostoma duodenale]